MGLALGQYIKETRKSSKISSMKLSQEAKISKSYLDYVESGARDPGPDILAKLAAALDIHIDALFDMQIRDKLDLAISKLSAGNPGIDENVLQTVPRDGHTTQSIDLKALAMLQAAFRAKNDTARVADYIKNHDLRAIVKAGANLDDEELAKIRKVMESLYPEKFHD
ncbi:MAG: helix-turn-helix domain-containing protein [Spirochaetota bacterium]|jgi:transcriptional regulator with XRE-family HTH domain|nr:helix-turn-helix domain-containing protein [Spirochaetota bacterium]